MRYTNPRAHLCLSLKSVHKTQGPFTHTLRVAALVNNTYTFSMGVGLLVSLSVCPIFWPAHAAAVGLLLRARRGGDIDGQRPPPSGTAHSSKCAGPAGDIDGLLHGRRSTYSMRAVPRCQLAQTCFISRVKTVSM